MASFKYENEERVYFFDRNETNIEEMMQLELVASLENEYMGYILFFVYDLNGNKSFTSLN